MTLLAVKNLIQDQTWIQSNRKVIKLQNNQIENESSSKTIEIVTLRKDIQKKDMQNSSKVLDDIISSKNSYLDKTRLGYNQTEKGSSSKTTEKETYPKIYAETIKGDRR
jgi:hypothetical protein